MARTGRVQRQIKQFNSRLRDASHFQHPEGLRSSWRAWRSERHAVTRVLDDASYRAALLAKLSELADVLAQARAGSAASGSGWAHLSLLPPERGGF
jgi:hypothetical protein